MASLQDILYTVNIKSITGNAVDEVNDLQIDSRKVTTDSCFIAIKGSILTGIIILTLLSQMALLLLFAKIFPATLRMG